MFFSKKAVVTLTTFSLIIVASILILSFTFFYYGISTDRAEEYNARVELLTSIDIFRSHMLSLLVHDNSSLYYNSSWEPATTEFQLSGNHIYARQFLDSEVVIINATTLGFNFCDYYVYYPIRTGFFMYNGSCISYS